MRTKILLVEDDTEVVQLLTAYLEQHGFEVFACETPSEARRVLEEKSPSLMILDVMLPEVSGLDFCREIRRTWTLPIILSSALGQLTDRVVGLELGADDYLVKPYDPRELLARMKALLRRAGGFSRISEALRFQGLEIYRGERRVYQDGVEVDLSSSEYDTLLELVKNAGRTVSRDELIERLRGEESEAFGRAIDTTISRLRTKLGDDAQKPRFIKTVWGSGYAFVGAKSV